MQQRNTGISVSRAITAPGPARHDGATQAAFRRAALAAVFLAVLGSADRALAQSGGRLKIATAQVLEEVVVTSQKRAKSLDVQQIPTAISVYSGEALEQAFVIDLTDVGRYAPNVQLNDAGTYPGFANFFIRGVGVSNTTRSQDPAVGAFFDGIYVGFGPSAIAAAFDFESVEVLRGPQGTLFGKNVTGGAVSVTSRRPGREFGGYASARFANYDSIQLTGAVDLPLSDSAALRLAGANQSRDGYWKNSFTDRTKPEQDIDILRAVLRWEASDRLTLNLIGEYYRSRSGSSASQNLDSRIAPRVAGPAVVQSVFGYTPGDKYHLQHDLQGYLFAQTRMLVLNASYRAEHGVFTLVTGARDVRYDTSTDFDGSPFPVFHFPENREKQEQFSIEARYASSFSERFDFTAGLFYFTQAYDIGERREFFTGGNPQAPTLLQQVGLGLTDDESLAAFGEISYYLGERWTLLLGGRITDEAKEVTFCPFNADPAVFTSLDINECANPVNDDENWTSFSPRVGVDVELAENVMAYASWSTGFRSGSYNIRARVAEAIGPVDEEAVVTWEAGIKSTLLNARLRFNAAIFLSEYDDIQRTISDTVIIDGNPQVTQVLRNAAQATISGVEIETSMLLTESLAANFSLGYLDAQYDEFPGIDADRNGVYNPEIDDAAAENLKFERVPEFEFTAALQHSIPLAGDNMLRSRVAYQWRDKHFVDTLNSPSIAVDAYGLLDASVTYERVASGWSLSLFGRNLSEEEFHDFGFDGGTHRAVWGGVPRTYGVELRADF